MQVSRLDNGSIQFTHGDRQLEVVQPSPVLADFFGAGGEVACHSLVSRVAQKGLWVDENRPLSRWLQSNHSGESIDGQEFERANSTGLQSSVGAELIDANLVQATCADGSKRVLVMSGAEIYRLVQARYRGENLFWYRGDGQWMRFPPGMQFSDVHGDPIGQVQIWSRSLPNIDFIEVEALSSLTVLNNTQVELRCTSLPDQCTLIQNLNWVYCLMSSVSRGGEVVFLDPTSVGQSHRFFRITSSLQVEAKIRSDTLAKNFPDVAQDAASQELPVGVFRCQKVRSVEVECLDRVSKPTIYLFRYFIGSTICDGGSPVSVVQVGPFEEIARMIKGVYKNGPMLVPTPQLGLLVGLQLGKKETVWKIPLDDQLKSRLSSIGALYKVMQANERSSEEVTLVLEKGRSTIEITSRFQGSTRIQDQLSRDQFFRISAEGSRRLFKRTPTGRAPVSWNQFQVALAKSDPSCRHVKRIKVVGVAKIGLVELEVTDARKRTSPFFIQVSDLRRMATHFDRPEVDHFYLPFWKESEEARSTHWICFDSEMQLLDPSGWRVERTSLWGVVQNICRNSAFALGEIIDLSVSEEGDQAILTFEDGCQIYLAPDSLFRNLLAMHDGRSVVLHAKMGAKFEELPLKIRLEPETHDADTIDQLLNSLLSYVSKEVAQLPRGVFKRASFPVRRVEIKERGEDRYRFWFHSLGTAVDGAEVPITSFVEGSVDELVDMVEKGYQQERMLLGAQLPTGDRVYLEVDKQTTSWDIPKSSPFDLLRGTLERGSP